jgi:hypothetical protein
MAITSRRSVWGDHWIAAALLGVVVVLVYGDVVFMGYTLSPTLWSLSVLIPPFGYHGRWGAPFFPTVVDPLATGGQNWPVYVLIGKMIRSGQVPLWNPYQGTGAPLAADESWSTYFPFDLLYVFLGNPYWDYIWLLKLWTAGILAYFLLRHMGLSFHSAIGGGLAYCLSGAFIWSPFINWTNVAILTPALLLVVMKCFDQPFAPSIVVTGSLAFAISVLAAHLESLLIQFSYVFLFVIFEAATRRKQRKMFGVVTWVITIILGTGLAAFFLVPLQEYGGVAALFHGPWMGTISVVRGLPGDENPLIWWVSFFVPYLYSFLQTYFYAGLGRVFSWDNFPGYVGICVLFLSLLPLYPVVRRSVRFAYGKYYFFFLAAAILVLMKIFGVPPINWLGVLPGFQYVDFPRYSGSVLAMSFAGASAYGIELVRRGEARNVSWPVVLLMLTAILPVVLLTIPDPLSPFGKYFPVSVAYLALAIYYAVISACVAAKGGANAAQTLVALLVLELASYIPRSLTIQFEAVRVGVLAGTGLLLFVGTRVKNPLDLIESFRPLSNMKLYNEQISAIPTRKTFLGIIPPPSIRNAMTRRNFMVAAIVAALILQFSISGVAPNGIPQRYDPYTAPPYVKFLEANLGYQRAYSPDGLFFPPSAGVYTLQNLGEFSALMPSSFYAFLKANLDNNTEGTDLVGNGYVRLNPAISAQCEIRANIAFYSLLGVKYFVTSYTVLNMPVAYHDVNATIYENLRAFPRTFLIGHVTVASDEQDAILKTRELGWETRNATVLEGMPENEVSAIDSAAGEPGVTSIEQYSPSSVSIHVVALRASLLVLTDTYFPGWRAYLDGTPVPTYRAYGLVRGVFIPPGPHQVLFKYESTSFKIGVIISVLSAAVLSILSCSSVYRPKRRSG